MGIAHPRLLLLGLDIKDNNDTAQKRMLKFDMVNI